MEVKSSRESLAAIPAHMPHAIHRIAERDGEPIARVVKRLLLTGLAAEGEPVVRPKRVFSRIDNCITADVAL